MIYLGIAALSVIFIGVAIRLHRWTHPKDDHGTVSGNWLAEERGKRDGET